MRWLAATAIWLILAACSSPIEGARSTFVGSGAESTTPTVGASVVAPTVGASVVVPTVGASVVVPTVGASVVVPTVGASVVVPGLTVVPTVGASVVVPTVGASVVVPTVGASVVVPGLTVVPTVGASVVAPTVGASVVVPTVGASVVVPGLTVVPTVVSDLVPAVTATVEPTRAGIAEERPDPDKTLPPVNYDGEVRALQTASGAMVAVRGVSPSGYRVVTPCYQLATIGAGREIRGPIDVLIDPGHGGQESGAVGPNGLEEADINLRVAELLQAELDDRGYVAELTRYGDIRVAIQSRTELANALAPKIFISIHHNGGYPEPFPRAATEIFVQQNNGDSTRLGGLLFESIQEAFADVTIDWMGNEESHGVAWRQNREGADLYGILRRTPSLVTVLTEAMFITTEAEARLLAEPETAGIEARAIADAIERYFETDEPGSGFIEGIVFQGDLGNGGGTEGCVDPEL